MHVQRGGERERERERPRGERETPLHGLSKPLLSNNIGLKIPSDSRQKEPLTQTAKVERTKMYEHWSLNAHTIKFSV